MGTLIASAADDFDPKIKEIGDQIVNLSIMQAMALGRYIREVHGIEPMSYGVQIETELPVLIKEDDAPALVDVHLIKVADKTKNISVIKTIRELIGTGLAESKALVDKAPSLIKAKVILEDADKIKAAIEAAGGTVELR
jgi:large subunit ribosomal protein L7/L12